MTCQPRASAHAAVFFPIPESAPVMTMVRVMTTPFSVFLGIPGMLNEPFSLLIQGWIFRHFMF
jgi:hypothetical protein